MRLLPLVLRFFLASEVLPFPHGDDLHYDGDGCGDYGAATCDLHVDDGLGDAHCHVASQLRSPEGQGEVGNWRNVEHPSSTVSLVLNYN